MTKEKEKQFKAMRYFLTGPITGYVKKFETVIDRLDDYYGDQLVCVRGRRENADTKNKYDHYHLFLQFDRQVDFNKLKKVMELGNPHNRKVGRGQVEQTAHYCVKGACGDENCEHTWKSHGDKMCKDFNQQKGRQKAIVLKFGEVQIEGARTDLDEAKKLIQKQRTWEQVVNHPELTMVLARFGNWARECFANKPIPKMDEQLFEQSKNDWMDGVLALLDEEPNYRDIIWIWSNEGNVGKSLLAAYLVQNREAVVVTGKTNDILYQYSKTMNDIVVMDIPRSGTDFVNYGAIEALKNGVFAVNKYDSKMVVRGTPCHLVVMANEPPIEGMLSQDRLKVFNVDNTLEAACAWGWD